MKLSHAAKMPSPAAGNISAPQNRAPVAVVGWGKAADIRVAEYLEPRGSNLEIFYAAGCEVSPDASKLDPTYPRGPAATFNFYDPFTGEPYIRQGAHDLARPFHRIKPLGNRPEGSAKFLQPEDSGTHVFCARHPSMDWPALLRDPSHGLILTEGETRSLAGVARGLAVISITGVDCGQQNGQLHPDLARVTWKGRQVFFAFDSDVRDKDDPRRALRKLAGMLRREGAEVFEVKIPPKPDGSKQGLDDFLAAHDAETFSALVASSETHLMEVAGEYEPPTLLADIMVADYPPTEWVWDSFVLKGEVNLLSGDGGVGKSLFALHLLLAVAAGKPLFGGTTIPMPGLALFAEDGPSQVQQRARAILRDFKLDSTCNLPVKLWCQPRGEVALAQIDDTGMVKELPRLHALRAELADLHNQGFATFLVLDSLADLFAMNESLRLPVNAALKQVLGGLCRDFNATVLVLMHPSKTSMQDGTHYSGSTAFNNAVRQRLTLEAAPREKGDTGEGQPPRTLKVAKSNYGPLLEKTLWYCGATISNMSHETPTSAAQAQRFSKACIAEAVRAASVGIPITAQARIPEAIIGEITKTISRRPKDAEVKNELAAAALAGQLVYQRGTNKARAGYYPADKELAKVLSRRTKPPLLQRKDDAS